MIFHTSHDVGLIRINTIIILYYILTLQMKVLQQRDRQANS